MDKTIILNTWDENKNKKFMYVKTNSDSYILLYGKDFSNVLPWSNTPNIHNR